MSDDLRRQLPDDVVDELLVGARTEEEIAGQGGLLAQVVSRPAIALLAVAPEPARADYAGRASGGYDDESAPEQFR